MMQINLRLRSMPKAPGGNRARPANQGDIDLQFFEGLAQALSPGTFQRTLEKVHDEIEHEIPTLMNLVRAKNLEEVRKLAHKLAGSTGTVGAAELLGILSKIETAAKLGDAEEAEVAASRLTQVAHSTKEFLARHSDAMKRSKAV